MLTSGSEFGRRLGCPGASWAMRGIVCAPDTTSIVDTTSIGVASGDSGSEPISPTTCCSYHIVVTNGQDQSHEFMVVPVYDKFVRSCVYSSVDIKRVFSRVAFRTGRGSIILLSGIRGQRVP